MNTINIGIIGAGKIVQGVPKHIAEHGQAKVVAAYDPSAVRLAAFCNNGEIPYACESANALLQRDDVQAVYIAVPNAFHAPLALKALRSGKHVLLDKPFALNFAEAQAVVAAARDAKRVFCVGMNQRFNADSQLVRSLVLQGIFGEIYHAKAYWQRRWGIPKAGTWFGMKKLGGGGCLLDIGVHMLDLCLWTIDNFKPVSVVGRTYTRFGNRGIGHGGWGMSDPEPDYVFDVDDLATALINFENGLSVTLDVSWAAHREAGRDNVEIFGTDAGASIRPAKVFRRDPLREEYDVIDQPKKHSLFSHTSRHYNFINAVLGREELCCKPEQSLVVQKILDAIYASASAGGKQVAV